MSKKVITVGRGGWLSLDVAVDLPTERFQAAAEKAAKPFSGTTGKAALMAMRYGPGSVDDQFDRETEDQMNGSFPWEPTKSFGNVPAPEKTLQRTGSLKAAWLGGPGSVTIQTDSVIGVGVDVGVVGVRAAVFQGDVPTLVKPKTVIPGRESDPTRRRWSMWWKLGLTFGVWLSEEKMREGLKIVPRRVGVGPVMREEIGLRVLGDLESIINGEPLLSEKAVNG